MNQELKYLYVVLDRPDSPLHSIKTIMFDKKVKGEDGEICFYSPYNELYTAYSKKYPELSFNSMISASKCDSATLTR